MAKKIETNMGEEERWEITPDDLWNPEKMKIVTEYIRREAAKQTPEQILRNHMVGIRFHMEDYLRGENAEEEEMQILDFVKLFLEAMKITQKEMAEYFGMKDSNLYKYLTGERRLNADLVMKLSSFTHTKPELWYQIQIKNELAELKKQRRKMNAYKKYDYLNFKKAG